LGILDDLEEKLRNKESRLSVSVEDLELKLPISGRTVRLGGTWKLDNIKLGFGRGTRVRRSTSTRKRSSRR
jgi:hypothetical protein